MKKKMFQIFLEKDYIVVYLNDKIFFKQEYIKNKQYTFFYVLHILNKFGMEAYD
jgi:hypothetical protein